MGLISQLENGKGNPSFATLHRIAYGLGVPSTALFDGASIGACATVVRRDTRKRLILPHVDLQRELLTPDLNRAYEFVWFELAPGTSTAQHPFQHLGEQSLLILEGMLEIQVGTDTYVLEPGDSITHVGSVPHYYVNPTERVARGVAVGCPPFF